MTTMWPFNKRSIVLLVTATAGVLLLANFGHADAAGPYDGEWSGSARVARDGRCNAANVTLTIRNNEAAGQAKFELESRSIFGTVRPDGTLGATIGFQYLTGKFTGDSFEGTFQTSECGWTVTLRRGTPQPMAQPLPLR
ncbi:MAG TPA: hypothetical protein VKE26_25980 [Xanthobacteraceae bacterium]|nr:hypothetical protein [Xanthobacteraceae bacterium]